MNIGSEIHIAMPYYFTNWNNRKCKMLPSIKQVWNGQRTGLWNGYCGLEGKGGVALARRPGVTLYLFGGKPGNGHQKQ